MQTKEQMEFGRFAKRFEDLYGYYSPRGFNVEVEARRYWRHLKGYTVETIFWSFDQSEKNFKFFPKITDLLKLIDDRFRFKGGSTATQDSGPLTPEERDARNRAWKIFSERFPGFANAIWGGRDVGLRAAAGFRKMEGVNK